MKTIVGAVTIQHRLMVVGALVKIVSQLVMNGTEVFCRDLNAHLDADVVNVVNIPGAGMANHFIVFRPQKHGAFPEGLWKRSESQRNKEAFSILHHLKVIGISSLENLGE